MLFFQDIQHAIFPIYVVKFIDHKLTLFLYLLYLLFENLIASFPLEFDSLFLIN